MIDSNIRVMAILNATPDSFFSGSRCNTQDKIESRVRDVIDSKADIVDIGGYSSRPGATDITPSEECERVLRAFEIVRSVSDVEVSVDTFRAEVVERVYKEFGRFTVNDISAGDLDCDMIPLVGQINLPYIAMHMKGTPQTMQQMTSYINVVDEVKEYFIQKISQLRAAGVDDITIDPGFGFAKTMEQNYQLLSRLSEFQEFGCEILAGLSRKSMIWRMLGTTPDDSLVGTAALNWEALRQGATILRVHDVREVKQIVKLFKTYDTIRSVRTW